MARTTYQRPNLWCAVNSEYIDWSSIELIDTESRVNYTDTTVEIKQTDRVTYDLIIWVQISPCRHCAELKLSGVPQR